MLDKDKLFLVFYLNIENIQDYEVSEYLDQVARAFQFDDSIEKMFVPIREGETRVECINPVLLNEEQYAEVEKKIASIKEEVSEILKNLKND